MSNRYGRCLLFLALLALDSVGTIQAQPMPAKQSHQNLPGELDMSNAQEMMAQRLRELHELHQLQDKVQDLLKDPDFLNNIQRGFSEDQLRQLREKMLKGEGLGRDDSWKNLLDQAAKGHKLDQQQINILRRWAERGEQKPTLTPDTHSLIDGKLPPAPPMTSSPKLPATDPNTPPAPEESSEQSLYERMQKETTEWFSEHLEDVGGDIMEAILDIGVTNKDAPLAGLLREMRQAELPADSLAERASGWSEYLPDVKGFVRETGGVWEEMGSVLGQVSKPSLPRFGGSANAGLPATSAVGGAGWIPQMLILSLAGLSVFLVWKMSLRTRASVNGSESAGWCLGSWPVSPRGVSTRHDLVRAFEHLALLCLGVTASTCHHRALAERLAAQDSTNPARRQAAETLAWLYEQARYAPPDEALSPGELTDARHALCLLAGVTAA